MTPNPPPSIIPAGLTGSPIPVCLACGVPWKGCPPERFRDGKCPDCQRPPAIRSPLDCVQTAVANLQMAADAELARAVRYEADKLYEAGARHDGAAGAYRQAIALIRSEFQGYL